MNLVIRRAELNDFATAYALVSEYYEAAQVIARDNQDKFQAEYFSGKAGFFVACSGSDLAGCVALREMNSESAEIKRLYVRPGLRGQGIAQKLLEAAEAFAKSSGYHAIYLDTASDMHAAARLYERNGYQSCERYNDNPQATIFMRKELLRTSAK